MEDQKPCGASPSRQISKPLRASTSLYGRWRGRRLIGSQHPRSGPQCPPSACLRVRLPPACPEPTSSSEAEKLVGAPPSLLSTGHWRRRMRRSWAGPQGLRLWSPQWQTSGFSLLPALLPQPLITFSGVISEGNYLHLNPHSEAFWGIV